jgi:magnesium-transporting ATPase (P-type)
MCQNDKTLFTADGRNTALTPSHIGISSMSSHKKQCKKESDPFTLTEEQCRVIILLVKETV